MNDIDRSVDTFDFAMRRRFRFVEVTAESQLGMLDTALGDKAEEAKKRLRNLNVAIENVQELNSHYHIGPSYFLNLKDVDFDYESLWSDYLKPLLEDYVRGSYEEAEILETLKKAFDLTNNEHKDQVVADDNEGMKTMMRITDNQHKIVKEEFVEEYPKLSNLLLDRTLESLSQDERVFIFPNDLKNSPDLEKDQKNL